jgi:hypothetical protein
MFNLEQSIAEWRQQMLGAGIRTPVPLEELEIHLREETERQAKSGLSEKSAFKSAVEKIGRPDKLKTEFRKIPVPLETKLVKLAGVACGVVGGLFLLWTAYVGLFLREANWGSRAFSLLAVAALIASWRYAGRFLPAIRHGKIRAATSLSACVAGVGGTLLFIRLALPNLFVFTASADFSINRLLVSFIIAWTALAVLGVFAYRLDEAAGQTDG